MTEFWARVRALQSQIDAIPYTDRGAYAPREAYNHQERAILALLALPPRQEDADYHLLAAEELMATAG